MLLFDADNNSNLISVDVISSIENTITTYQAKIKQTKRQQKANIMVVLSIMTQEAFVSALS